MTYRVILLIHDTNPFSDPAVQAALVTFIVCFLGFTACLLWIVRHKPKPVDQFPAPVRDDKGRFIKHETN